MPFRPALLFATVLGIIMDEKVNILLVEAPGRWRDSLLVLLGASPIVGEVQVWDGEETAVCPPTPPPAILLLDANTPNAGAIWRQWQRRSASACCCALVHSSAQEQAAQQHGIQAILRAGFTAPALFATLNQLLWRSKQQSTGQK